MFALCIGKPWTWQNFSKELLEENACSKEAYEKIRETIGDMTDGGYGVSPEAADLLILVTLMVHFDPKRQSSAAELAESISEIQRITGRARITPKAT